MASKRELVDTGTDKRYVRRDKAGRFKETRVLYRAKGALGGGLRHKPIQPDHWTSAAQEALLYTLECRTSSGLRPDRPTGGAVGGGSAAD